MNIKRRIQVSLNSLFPDFYNSAVFLVKNHYACNLKNPISFNEKIQWRKKYQHDERYPKLVDKYTVREYVRAICPEILVNNYGIYNDVNSIDFNLIPDSFIAKPTHGFGKVFICQDKSSLDLSEFKKQAKSWLDYNQYDITGEWQYKLLKPRIIIDELLGDNIMDYKFFCFDGKVAAIQIDSDRYISHKRQFRDCEWNKLNISLAYPMDTQELEKPKELNDMLRIAEKLSKGFDFVRVDLFLVKHKIYFSELTFTPGNGMDRFYPKEADYEFGKLWNLG